MANSDATDDGRHILYLLSVVQKRIQRALDAEIKQSIDSRLSISHGDIIFYLLLHPRARIGEVTHHLGVTKSTMTVLLRKLETMNMIRRVANPEDGRTTCLELTDNAREVVGRARKLGVKTRQRVLSGLSQHEISHLVTLLSKIKEATED